MIEKTHENDDQQNNHGGDRPAVIPLFLGAQILVPGMPVLIEIVILFDLLIVVACFGVLIQYLLDQ